MLPPAVERACQMFTAKQYRAKAAEFGALLTNTPRSPNETKEFRDLEHTYAALAEEEEQNFEVSGRGPCLCAGILFPRSSNGSSSTAAVRSVICTNNAAQGTDSSLPSQS
jgi:hypothetical protein